MRINIHKIRKRVGTICLHSCIIYMLGVAPETMAQSNTYDGHYTRPFAEVIGDISERFGVTINIDVDTAGLALTYADSRIRPYSLEETLVNVLKPLDLRYERKGKNKYVIRKFDYPRRLFEEGEKMIDYLSTLYDDRESWEARRDTLRSAVRGRLGIDALLSMRTGDINVRMSEVREYDGYTVQNYALETLPGLWVCGSIYTPSSGGKHPLIICPNGHFTNGRYNEEQQIRKATLARMGAICVDYDLIGWGESALQLGEESHRTDLANVLQLVNGISILDFMYDRADVDTARIGLNGGSGGGTQVVYLSLLDTRYTAACPTVSLAAHFDGGCPCESGMAATVVAGGTCHPEMVACFAPRPMMVVSDGGDWTANVPTVEYPYLQRIYSFYGQENNVKNVHLPDERHDFGPNKRQGVYDFFIDTFGLDRAKLDENAVAIEPAETMQTYRTADALPQNAIRNFDELKEKIRRGR